MLLNNHDFPLPFFINQRQMAPGASNGLRELTRTQSRDAGGTVSSSGPQTCGASPQPVLTMSPEGTHQEVPNQCPPEGGQVSLTLRVVARGPLLNVIPSMASRWGNDCRVPLSCNSRGAGRGQGVLPVVLSPIWGPVCGLRRQ